MVGFAVRNLIPVISIFLLPTTDGSWGFGSGGIIVKVTININGTYVWSTVPTSYRWWYYTWHDRPHS